jgi:hypothetical protein
LLTHQQHPRTRAGHPQTEQPEWPRCSRSRSYDARPLIPILAHGFGGTGGLPLPRWLLAYGIGFAVVITFVVLRVVMPSPQRSAPRHPRQPSTPILIATRSLGFLGFAGVIVAAAVGVDDSGANIAPVTVIVIFWLGLQALSVVGGDVFWLLNPFDTIARTINRRTERTSPDPHWTAAALLLAFVWFVFAYPEFYPPSPREVAWFLAIYTVAVVAGATLWGRAWVREGEGFSAMFGLLARRRERPPSAGTVALLSVYLGAVAFDGISQTNWWIDVLGTSRGWSERLINTVGMVWIVATVALVYLAATRVAARLTDGTANQVAAQFAPMLVPLGVALSVAHYLRAFLADVQNFVALLSDPLGRGWNLVGTIDNTVNYQWLTPTETGWVQTAVLLGGCVASAIVVHRIAFTSYRGRTAVRAIYPMASVLVLAAVGAVALLLGT